MVDNYSRWYQPPPEPSRIIRADNQPADTRLWTSSPRSLPSMRPSAISAPAGLHTGIVTDRPLLEHGKHQLPHRLMPPIAFDDAVVAACRRQRRRFGAERVSEIGRAHVRTPVTHA